MVALYWGSLARDVHFSDYDANPITNEAAVDLSRFYDYRGPKVDGRITPRTLFRGNTPDDLVGPYISQFLLKDVPYGVTTIVQRCRTTLPGDDYMTTGEGVFACGDCQDSYYRLLLP